MRAGRAFDFILRHRLSILLTTLLVTVSLSSFASLELENTLRTWFLDDDPEVERYDRFLDQFQNEEFIALAMEGEQVYSEAFLDDLDRLTNALESLGPEYRVTSIANVRTVELIDRVEDGVVVEHVLRVEPVLDAIPADDRALDALRTRVQEDRLLMNMVAPDERSALIIIAYPHCEDYGPKQELIRQVRRICREMLPHRSFRLAGMAIIQEAMQDHTYRDLAVCFPLAMMVIWLATFLLFRTFWAPIISSVIVSLSVGSTLGLAAIFGVKLNFVTTVVIPLGVAMGVADFVHLTSGYYRRLRSGTSPAEALRTAWVELLVPCLFTSLTTGAGLLSLVASRLAPIQDFGWMGALVVGLAFVLSMLLFPIALSYLPPPKLAKTSEHPLMKGVLRSISNLSLRWPRAVFTLSIVVLVLGAVGIGRIGVRADFASYFESDDPVRVDADFFDEHLGGSLPIEIVVEAPTVLAPEVLAGFEALESYVGTFSGMRSVWSPASVVKVLHERYFGDPEYYRIPDGLPAVAQLVSQIEGSALYRDHFTTSASTGRLTTRFAFSDLREIIDAADRELQSEIDAAFSGVAVGYSTGYGRLMSRVNQYILSTQLRSFTIAFIVIAMMVGLLFRSLQVAIWAALPNLLPIVLVMGLMGWLGIDLDAGTVMVASILLGLVVDDSVHFLTRFQRELRIVRADGGKEPVRTALFRAGTRIGQALLSTSLILALSFWALLPASFEPIEHFGLLSGIAVLIALLADLLLLPSIIRLLPLRRLERASSKPS